MCCDGQCWLDTGTRVGAAPGQHALQLSNAARAAVASAGSTQAQRQGREGQPRTSLLILDSASAVISPVLGADGPLNQGHALMTLLAQQLRAIAQAFMLAVIMTNHTVGTSQALTRVSTVVLAHALLVRVCVNAFLQQASVLCWRPWHRDCRQHVVHRHHVSVLHAACVTM